MTYQTYETSNQNARPISLYEFQWGATIWRYTSADRDITVSQIIDDEPTDVVYTAVAIMDSGVKQGGDVNNDLTITASSAIPLAALFQSTPPADTIRVTVRRRHETDPDGEAFIHWKGYVSNVKRSQDNASIDMVCNTLLSSFARSGLRLTWTRGCPHVLYDQECRVDPADHVLEYLISAKTGNTISSLLNIGPEEGWATGGYVEWDVSPGTVDRRSVSGYTNAKTLRLLGTSARIEVGMTVRVYPGCNLTMEMCRARFNNRANYGGCKQMTGKSPFDGTPII